jgi:ribosome biogenesis protein Nip4
LPNNPAIKLYILLNGDESNRIYPQIFLISSDVLKSLDFLKEKHNIQFTGILFGFIKKGELYLSLESAEFLFNNGYASDFKRLYVNDNGEKSILYGNNILKKMIKKLPKILTQKDFLIVFNGINEIIAIAQSLVENESFQKMRPDSIIALNLSDKGKYLRRKQ